MKKIIFASLTVLSLGLFSFAPAPAGGSIIKTQCGDYIINDQSTSQQVMSPADYQLAGQLIGQIYNLPAGSGQTKVEMIPTASAKGGCVNELWVYIFTAMYRQFKWDDASAVSPNPSINQYLAILEKYSNPQ
ncbi:MAG: hypothetical protein H0X33_08880 [Taibaiella sp.]|nr:hypothetical protein [Taibaiella sp.]